MTTWDSGSAGQPLYGGFISVENSTSNVLAGDAVFTGAREDCSPFSTVTVFVFADVASAASGLRLERSVDGVNWDHVESQTVVAGEAQTHSISVVSQFFRIVYTNGPIAQNEFRIQAIYHVGKPHGLSGSVQQLIQPSLDASLVRQVSVPWLDVNDGLFSHVDTVVKSGRNSSVDTGAYEDIWLEGGKYNWLTAASAVRIRAGGDVGDTAAGAGARAVVVSGLDEAWNPVEETIATAGASASSPTTATFIRVFSVNVADVGAYTGTNIGAITLETTGGVSVAGIAAGLGQSQLSMYSVPAGKRAFLLRVSVSVSQQAGKSATVRIWQRPDADVIAAPFGGARFVDIFDEVSGSAGLTYVSYPSFEERTDIWADAIGDANSTLVDVVFDLVIVDM